MPAIHDRHALNSRVAFLLDELSTGRDPNFDAAYDDLDREFAELRLHFGND
jgi:hypothetical protein